MPESTAPVGAVLLAPRFLRGCCAAILAAALAAPTPAYPQADEAAKRAAELELLRDRIGELRAALDRDLGRRDAARAALRDSEQTVAKQAAMLRDIERRLAQGERRLRQLNTERAERAAELSRERDALAGQVRAAHALGRQERLKLMLNQQDPASVGRTLVYYDYLNRSRVARIERVAALIAEVAELEARATDERDRLAQTRDEQRAVLAAHARTRDQRAEVMAALERGLRDQSDRLRQLERDEEALVRLLESLSNLLADVPESLGATQDFPSLRGGLAWPARGGVSLRFGERGPDGQRSRGLLIAAQAGAEVRAVAYGRVAWAGWMPHYGNLVVLEHGGDYFSLYAHNQSLVREVGEWVGAGEVIATVGDSGGQPAPGLYFELRNGRTPLNPQQWLVRR